MEISVIIPTRNESSTLAELTTELRRVFDGNGIEGEIVVVDDNSEDGTGELADKLSNTYDNFRVLHRAEERGIGSAIKEGCLMASHDILVTMDSDFSHPPDALISMLKAKKDGIVVVGSRFAGGSMKAPFLRIVRSRVINGLTRAVLSPDIRDYTGGFLVFDRNFFLDLGMSSTGGEFSIELLHKAVQKGYAVIEIPISYVFRGTGKSKTGFFVDGWRYLKTISRLKNAQS